MVARAYVPLRKDYVLARMVDQQSVCHHLIAAGGPAAKKSEKPFRQRRRP